LEGKSRVLKRLEKTENSRGLIDEDPLSARPPLMSRYQTVVHDEDDIMVLYHQQRDNHLIVLCPRAEEWILKAAKQSNIELGKYGLPDEADRFHESVRIKQRAFDILINEMLRKGNRRLMILAKFIQ
jgi:hypothetical protein